MKHNLSSHFLLHIAACCMLAATIVKRIRETSGGLHTTVGALRQFLKYQIKKMKKDILKIASKPVLCVSIFYQFFVRGLLSLCSQNHLIIN